MRITFQSNIKWLVCVSQEPMSETWFLGHVVLSIGNNYCN